MLEAVILSTTMTFVALGKKEGRKSALLLERLKKNIDRPLAAILTVNTIANTVGATGVGAQVQKLFGDEALAISSAAMTFTLLVFSEIIPKTLGAVYWRPVSPYAAYIVQFLIFLTYPFVLMSEYLSSFLAPAIKSKLASREEMIITAELSAIEGSIQKNESKVIKNLLKLNNMFVSDIMTPRSVMVAFEEDITVDEVMKTYRPIRFSRIPVYRDNLDQILGLTHRYKIIEASAHDQDNLKVSELMVPVHSVPESISVAASLDQFIKRREHLFICVDEYGVATGIVTLEDAVETLLGVEIVDEFDNVEDMRKYALEQWKQRKQELRQLQDKVEAK